LAAGVLAGCLAKQPATAEFTSQPPEAAAPSESIAQQTNDPPRENRLAKESSPYLLLHKHNPVDWYPWGKEAFAKAQADGKPIFLSIGYSSCYWCHVMERESFSNPEIADVLNEHFVCIKVDREELPDVDDVYMTAVHAMGIRGGWPLSVFLTPDRKPFFGGTYFPPTDRGDMPGFTKVLERVAGVWREDRKAVEEMAERVVQAVGVGGAPRGFTLAKLDRELVNRAVAELADRFDTEHGGFDFNPRRPNAPKFPQPSNLQLLLYSARHDDDARARAMLTLTLDRLDRGGIWDHLAGGFHRYSTDRYWLVPHFEKMLYDNAQLASVYLEAFELTQEPRYRKLAESIFRFVAAEMTSRDGGFYSALDAESEHEEGKYYVWARDEVRELLADDEFELFAAVYGLDGPPNFEGNRFVLALREPLRALAEQQNLAPAELKQRLGAIEEKLLAARAKRIRPLLDTKILTDWNGLMIAALADGYRILGKDGYRAAAERAAELLLSRLRDSSGRLLHVYAADAAKVPGYLDDYAFLIQGLLALHRATDDPRWLNESRSLVEQMIKLFWDDSIGGFYRTGSGHEIVLARLKPSYDSVVPSGNSAAVRGLVALAERTGEPRYAELAGKTLAAFAQELTGAPSGNTYMVRGLAEYLDAGHAVAWLSPRPDAQDRKVVQAKAVISPDRPRPGDAFEITVTLQIADHWHINANPASLPELTATTLKLESELPLENVNVRYPKPRELKVGGQDRPVAVFEGEVRLVVTAMLGRSANAGKGELKLTVQYQACDATRCLAPQSIDRTVTVEVASGTNE
jgi:hypothetical protein